MDMSVLVQEFSNVGLTLLCIVVGAVVVRWLDRNLFNKKRRVDYDKWD